MKGPTIGIRSHVFDGPDDEGDTTSEELIEAFTAEFIEELAPTELNRLEAQGNIRRCLNNAETVALYLARFHNSKNPWWADVPRSTSKTNARNLPP